MTMTENRERKVVSAAPSANFPFSTCISYGDLIFVSGLIGRNPATGEIAKGDISEQTRQTLRNVQSHLEKAGTSLNKALKLTIFILDMSQFAEMNQAYREFFTNEPPARSCVQVSALPDAEALVEIEVIAGR
jgi:2-iminobutanoate/2-iminopropanoate deaminase